MFFRPRKGGTWLSVRTQTRNKAFWLFIIEGDPHKVLPTELIRANCLVNDGFGYQFVTREDLQQCVALACSTFSKQRLPSCWTCSGRACAIFLF